MFLQQRGEFAWPMTNVQHTQWQDCRIRGRQCAAANYQHQQDQQQIFHGCSNVGNSGSPGRAWGFRKLGHNPEFGNDVI
jgi:hypothetical protein